MDRKNDIEMHAAHNETKSVVAERFIRILKNKVYKHMTSISKNVYIDELDDIVNERNNTYWNTIKMKHVDVKSSREINDKDPKFKLVILLEYQNIKTFLQKVIFQIGLKKFLWLKKSKTLCRGHVISDLKSKESVTTFYQKGLQKTNQKKFRV